MKLTDLAAVVASQPFFAGVPEVATLVAGCAQNAAFAQGERIFAEGDPADHLYLLRRGRVALEVASPRGPLIIETLQPGEALGWSWLFPPYRWSTDARALEPVGAIVVDAECLRNKAEIDPAFGYELMKRLSAPIAAQLHATQVRLLDLYGDARRV
jgi:CRP/FNR family cyclic AMP-dependent transcriptional regulator